MRKSFKVIFKDFLGPWWLLGPTYQDFSGFFMAFRGRQDLLNLSGFELECSKMLKDSWRTFERDLLEILNNPERSSKDLWRILAKIYYHKVIFKDFSGPWWFLGPTYQDFSGFFMAFRGRQDLLNLSGFKLQHSKILQGSWTTLRILSWTDFEALCRILTVLQDAGAILWRRGCFVFRSKLDIRYIFKSFHYYSQAPLDKYWKFSET